MEQGVWKYFARKVSTLSLVNFWDSIETPLSIEEQDARPLRAEFKKIVLLEELPRRQKSREIWLR